MDEPADSSVNLEEWRAKLDELARRWRGDTVRVGERAGATLHGVLHELGLVTRDEWDELELRVAQLEHRLRLVENDSRPVPIPRD